MAYPHRAALLAALAAQVVIGLLVLLYKLIPGFGPEVVSTETPVRVAAGPLWLAAALLIVWRWRAGRVFVLFLFPIAWLVALWLILLASI
jgi:hypothetical protein